MSAFNLLTVSVTLTLPLFTVFPSASIMQSLIKSPGESQGVMLHSINTKHAVLGERGHNWK